MPPKTAYTCVGSQCNSKGMLKQKLGTQLLTARNSFNGIAEKQADARTLMADSLSVIGKALNAMADNDAKRTENDTKMIALYDKILQNL